MSIIAQNSLKEGHAFTVRHTTYRVNSIDILRGLVMIIMALDHTRDFFHIGAYNGTDPLNAATTTPILYFTRWITHFCAPIFVFLAGTSIYLQGLRKTKKQLSGFLIKRGLWLIGIEVFIMSFAFTFDVNYHYVVFQVIWSIGISMILLGLINRLPIRVLFAIGIVIVAGHNLLDYVEAKHVGAFGFTWDLLHRGNFALYKIWGNHILIILYPFLPWTGLMLLGYCLGTIYKPSVDPKYRRKLLLQIGVGLIVFFIALRATNSYGNPFKWSVQRNAFYTVLSFLNVNKYPPSLLYMCMTIGPGLIFLSLIENVRNKITSVFNVYGRVPFFYYVLHFYILHIVCVILFLSRGHTFSEGLRDIPNFPFKFVVPGEGYPLWMVYIIWIAVVASLYPLCKWFSNYKLRHRKWWLSYL
jgi:uncharacterized membrane protein